VEGEKQGEEDQEEQEEQQEQEEREGGGQEEQGEQEEAENHGDLALSFLRASLRRASEPASLSSSGHSGSHQSLVSLPRCVKRRVVSHLLCSQG